MASAVERFCYFFSTFYNFFQLIGSSLVYYVLTLFNMMIRSLFLILIIATTTLVSCKKDQPEPELVHAPEFVPTDVVFKTRANVTFGELFKFINEMNLEVEHITGVVLTSDFHPDSLQYVLDILNTKPYAGNEDWKVGGYNHYATNEITVFPKFYHINNPVHQQDWLETMRLLQLNETERGYVVYIHVPEGKEIEWVEKLKKYEFIEWAELNYILSITPFFNK